MKIEEHGLVGRRVRCPECRTVHVIEAKDYILPGNQNEQKAE